MRPLLIEAGANGMTMMMVMAMVTPGKQAHRREETDQECCVFHKSIIADFSKKGKGPIISWVIGQ